MTIHCLSYPNIHTVTAHAHILSTTDFNFEVVSPVVIIQTVLISHHVEKAGEHWLTYAGVMTSKLT